MTANNSEKFQQKYQAGKEALEMGQSRQSIEYLEIAKDLVPPNSRRGGEVQIWLVTAYQAASQIDQAIALAKTLITHPDAQTREQAQRILYIMQAPQLQRPKEWMSEIPDLTQADQETTSRYVSAKPKSAEKPQAIELNISETAPTENLNNQFVWFALGLTILIVGGLFWFNQV